MFSKACEYGIRAAIYIGQQSKDFGRRVGLKDIAAEIDSPEAFTAKVLQQLVREQLVTSVKGPTGGFELTAEQLRTVTLKQIVLAIDGPDMLQGCALGLRQCSAKQPCPMHYQFLPIRDQLNELLRTHTVGELAGKMHEGLSFLKQ
ncbi:transcriptional regulator, BadM/Rrf2 family [Hymenobacter gelipurpurascens]|uniref:Transcriptional regulator, BadM/Rrf2 family n=1 Tax=Hymenobacter gelipurpurascens TaxID=89968 RepID=A0A212TLZ3_9BACT|nr:Rrf2 family transcriptional regulator [Hymenobacter gelipurpurascens]SNC67079.1 transcriptional regulator, BadM/Rrf2 family [Hymenobacter gelipurpurascens]